MLLRLSPKPRQYRSLGHAALLLAAVAVWFMAPQAAEHPLASNLKSDERLILFPVMASSDFEGRIWHVPIHGWVFEPETDDLLRRTTIATLGHAMGLEAKEPVSTIFRSRLQPFLVDNERGKRIHMVCGDDQDRAVFETEVDGHGTAGMTLARKVIEPLQNREQLILRAILPDDDDRVFEQKVYLLNAEGITVVSDIDDTVKISNVRDKKQLLRNTFLKPFEAVPGVAGAYQRWQREDGVHVHFVSSSPWQLYEALSDFLHDAGFPEATFDLKRFRLKDSTVLEMFADPIESKTQRIDALIRRFPKRHFVLVGDSGEKDPEVYAGLIRKHPRQIRRILIRDVTGEGRSSDRYAKLFDGIDPMRWSLFKDGSTLPVRLTEMPVQPSAHSGAATP